jgi:hypothetical protein
MPSLPVNVSASGNTTLIAADPAGRSIRVVGYHLSAAGSLVIQFQDTESNVICGPLHTFDNGTSHANHAPRSEGIREFLFATAPGAGLVINLSAAVNVGGYIDYEFSWIM